MNKLPKPWSMKALFALSSIACVCFTVALGYFGLTAYGEYQVRSLQASFPAEATRAQKAIERLEVPDIEDTKVLMKAYREVEAEIEEGQNFALLVFSIVAALLGAGLSILLANYFSRPIEAVAGAARAISEGDLTVRAKSRLGDIGEGAQLVTDFNHMASALERFEREMNESSAAIAHELRTPLTVLRGYVQGSIDGVFPPTHEHLSRLMLHIDSLSRVVDDLQTLSLATNGKLSMAMEAMDASEEIRLLLDAMEPAIHAAGLTLERNLKIAVTQGDPVRLRQAVSALIDNVLRYAPSGGTITVQSQTTRNGIVIRVLDRGPGLPEAQLERMFERFWRGEPSRGKISGGSGLGLSVVKAIVNAHNGTILANNRPRGGLSVEITLPNARAALK